MPFIKTHEVGEAFFNLFLDKATQKKVAGDSLNYHPMLPVTLYSGVDKDFMVRYYNRSGESSIEDTLEYYPCIVIQDFQPELDRSIVFGKDYIEGIVDELSGKTELITLPIPMSYRFQVSSVTRRLSEVQGAQDWFLNTFNFQRSDCFEFNKLETDEGYVADIVPYSVSFANVPREDGRFEYSYDFKLSTFIHAKSKQYTFSEEGGYTGGNFEDMVESIKFALNMKNISTFEQILQTEFEIN